LSLRRVVQGPVVPRGADAYLKGHRNSLAGEDTSSESRQTHVLRDGKRALRAMYLM
jgi:hypothetical protein